MRRKALALLIITTSLLAACATPVYVQKEAVGKTKTVAVVSVQSNSTLYPVGGGGGGVTALVSLANKAMSKKPEGKGPDATWVGQLVSYAHDTFARTLSEIGGWRVKSGRQVTDTAAYRSFAEEYKGSSGESLLRTAAAGMPTGEMDTTEEDTVEDLAELAENLGVDSVAVVDLDIGFEPSAGVGNIGGGMTGTAAASVRVRLGVLGKDEVWVLDPEGARSQIRQKSSSTVVMVLGNIAPNDKAMAAFKEAIDKAAAAYKAEVLAAMTKK